MCSNDDDSAQSGIEALTDAVKSRILDRVLVDLRERLALGNRGSEYTKSDSGVYGKYQKADLDLTMVLDVVSRQIDAILVQHEDSDHEATDREPPKPGE